MPKLVIHEEGEAREIALGTEPVTCGRGAVCQARIADDRASREHCRFELEDGIWYVTNLASSNGTFVDGRRIDREPLVPGALIRVGETRISFVQGERETKNAGLGGLLTRRVKILAGVVAAVLILGVVVRLLLGARSAPTVYPDNLLRANPSFEQGAGPELPGWVPAKGAFSPIDRGVQDGEQALRLVGAAGATEGVSALLWSAEVEVSPERNYELSALVRSAKDATAALCILWLSDEHLWIRCSQLGTSFSGTGRWRRAAETFQPPSSATHARAGVAVLGAGSAELDGFRLREVEKGKPRPRLGAGRLEFETGPVGEATLFVDDTPAFTRGRLAVLSGGRRLVQSLGRLDPGQPQVRARGVSFAGRLGPAEAPRFAGAMSTDGSEIVLTLEAVSVAAGSSVLYEFVSGPDLLEAGVRLDAEAGTATTENAAFAERADIRLITFGQRERRVFLELSAPVRVTATAGRNDAVTWTLELPLPEAAAGGEWTLTWSGLTAGQAAEVAAALDEAAQAERNVELGRAVGLYRHFLRTHPRYAAEREEAEQRLRNLYLDITTRIAPVLELVKRARASQADLDYATAERALEDIVAKLEGMEDAAQLVQTLEGLRKEHAATAEKRRQEEAAGFLARARHHVRQKEFIIGRAECEHIIREFPGTPYAEEAKQLLETLPEDE